VLPKISACLLSWRRPENVRRVVEQLLALDCVGEILIWNNQPACELRLPKDRNVRVIDSDSNLIRYGRYSCAAQAAFPLIYVQDDDVLVHDIPALLGQFLSDPTRIHFNLSDWHFARRERHLYQEHHSALLGSGAIFHKDWLSVLDLVPEAARKGRLFQREADQYFTLLQGRHHAARLGALTLLEGHSEPGLALWLAPEHWQMSSLAVRDALGLARCALGFALPPRWHVVVVCHDYGHYLTEAVESVLLNDADYELTIVDDASSDETPRVVAELCDKYPHLRSIRHEQQRGVSRARNTGIASLDSTFVVLLDADDRLGGDYLFEANRVLGAGADVANPDAILFGSESGRWPTPKASTLGMILKRNSIHYCSAFRRSWWSEVGGFDEHVENWEDYDFWIRVLARGARTHHVPGDHFYYRRHAGSRSLCDATVADRVQARFDAKYGHLSSR